MTLSSAIRAEASVVKSAARKGGSRRETCEGGSASGGAARSPSHRGKWLSTAPTSAPGKMRRRNPALRRSADLELAECFLSTTIHRMYTKLSRIFRKPCFVIELPL